MIRIGWVLFLMVFVAYAYIHQGWGWNQYSRVAQLHALYIDSSLSIDSYHEMTGDKAIINGRYYSDKAPGTAALAMPVFGITYLIFNLCDINIDSEGGMRISNWIVTVGSVGLVTSLGAVALFVLLSQYVGLLISLVSTLGIFLGSLPFPYATALFSHAGTIGLLSICLWGVLGKNRCSLFGSVNRDLVAGFCAGLAVASEYPALVAVLAICFYLAHVNLHRLPYFILGGLPFVLLIALYNYFLTGSPWELAYSHLQGFEGMKEGFFGISFPKIEVLYSLSFSQYRGLFFWSPFLLLSCIGYMFLYREDWGLFALTLFVPLFFIIFAASYYYWNGGYSFGPRHFSPAVPFIGLSSAFGIKKFPRIGLALVLLSIFLTGLVTCTGMIIPEDIHYPLLDFTIPRMLKGELVQNIGVDVLGLNGLLSLVPLLCIELVLILIVACLLCPQLLKFIKTGR